MTIRRIALLALFLATALWACLAQTQSADPGDALIGFLNQSIDWYRRVQLPGQLSTDPADSIYTAYNRNASVQAISLIFDFAREQAQQIQLEHPHDTAPVADNAQPSRNLPQLVASAQEKVKQTGADLEALEQQAANASGKKRLTLDDQVAEEKSELELAQARLETLENMSAFAVAGTSAGLLGKVNELERTVPEVRTVVRTARPLRPDSNRTEGASSGAARLRHGGRE